jgi:hypothetical protein
MDAGTRALLLKISKDVAVLKNDMSRIKEKVEKLTGERGDQYKSQSAIRRGELSIIGKTTRADVQILNEDNVYYKDRLASLEKDMDNIFRVFTVMSNLAKNADIPKV